ncbi:MAG: hypothetical protein ABSB26_02980 [Nitrososphaerales archaeon]|jgi:hypothetical protein
MRGLNDCLVYLETEYDTHIEARDLSDSIHDNVDKYQTEFDTMVRDFYDAVDKIEKSAFNICDSIEDDSPADPDEKTDEVLGEARVRVLKESRRLAERLNSLNLQPSWWLPSSRLPSIDDELRDSDVWICAEGCGRIQGAGEYERHRAFNPDHHPQVSDDVELPRLTATFGMKNDGA